MTKKRILATIVALVVTSVVILGGCTEASTTKETETSTFVDVNKLSNVDLTIWEEAENVSQNFPYVSQNLVIEKNDKFFSIYPKTEGRDRAMQITIPEDFDESKEFYVPEIQEQQVPETILSMYSDMKNVALEYIETTSFIREVDKPACKQAVENITLHYGELCNQMDKYILMITNENDIYINATLAEYMSKHRLLHEIIHVISNETNKESSYELSYYRASLLNEAISDIIAYQICLKNGIQVDASYSDFYEMAYLAIGITEGNLLSCYYYSDQYDQIIEKTGDIWDVYVLTTQSIQEDKFWYASPYVVSEFKEAYNN